MPKLCSITNCDTPVFSQGFCMYHYRIHHVSKKSLRQSDKSPATPFKAPYRTKEIKKVSTHQRRLNVVYNVAAAKFKKDYPECQVKLDGCQFHTTDIHHLYAGASRSTHFLDSREWKTTCDACHFKIHNVLSKEALFKLGLKKTAL